MTLNQIPAPALRNAVSCFDESTDSVDGVPVPMRVYEPAGTVTATLVWAHGGSWTRGSIRDWHLSCLALAQLGSTRIISVGYRLAPEWEHPTAMLDVAAATRWAQQTLASPVLVGGDSAGGTLAAGVALLFRDQGRQLDGQVLAYPPLDPDCSAESYWQPDQPFPPQSMLRRAWEDYSGGGENPRELPYLSPLHAKTLAGICPTAMLVGPRDPVKDDVEAFAIRLALAGVYVTVCQDPTVWHGQFLSGPDASANPVHTWVHDAVKHLTSMKASNHA